MTKLSDIVAVSAVRTPMGSFGGTLKDVPVYNIGAAAIKAALERSGFQGSDIAEVIYGSCRQAGNGPNSARSAMIFAGLPVEVPAITLNMACPSGMKSIMFAAEGIQAGRGEVYMTGGMDSMSTIPFLLKNCRFEGFKMGDRKLEDGWSDSIDPTCGYGMGNTAENLLEKHDVSRQEMDEFALASHQKAVAAIEEGRFKDETVPVVIPAKGKRPEVVFDKDETPRKDTTLEKLAKLPPAFKKEGGRVTAGNACGMSDGACALVLTTRERAKAQGAKPLFSLVSYAQAAVDGRYMGEGPGVSIPKALEKAGMTVKDMDLYEVNEAFAVQALVNVKTLGLDLAKLNVNGGAIALGHPTGISGARIIVTLYNALKQRGKELGVASICGGGGVTTAMVIRRED
ncbi:MAG: thiolase family protein [Proteobacteria bacterium]|jgi:acetyl-CoA C-acetyltransferase|nr:thiolase family protein [Pseudomonadota bacterium]